MSMIRHQKLQIMALVLLAGSALCSAEPGRPLLWRKVSVPESLLADEGYAGDIRIGDLDGDGSIEFVNYRSTGNNLKPCFIAAFDLAGHPLWQHGSKGRQPARPGPVTLYDFDGDGKDEILCFFVDPAVTTEPTSLANIVLQIRSGQSGEVLRQASPNQIRRCSGQGPNWVHQRLLIANLRPTPRPQDFVIKLGSTVLAFTDEFEHLWTYEIKWNRYGRCSAYIPAVGDIDEDGRDEVNGGYYLLDHTGRPLWEKQLGPHMDSVAIAPWDNGGPSAICSGAGHVLDENGNIVLKLGEKLVPHGQEVRAADFDPASPGPELVIRYNGHNPDVMVVANTGRILRRFKLNQSPNNTGMEAIFWNGAARPALLYNGGVLWTGLGRQFARLPDLPEPKGPAKMGWHHCIPANLCGDAREEIVVYNPWDRHIWIYTPSPLDADAFDRYEPTPRQYNPRLMD